MFRFSYVTQIILIKEKAEKEGNAKDICLHLLSDGYTRRVSSHHTNIYSFIIILSCMDDAGACLSSHFTYGAFKTNVRQEFSSF